MIRIRRHLNSDPPLLAALWNRGLPSLGVARHLTGHEFDAFVLDKPAFDPEGLLVAEIGDKPVGFVHAGFGPSDEGKIPRAVDTSMGAIVMLVVDPDLASHEVAQALMEAAEAYLRSKGSSVIYAGGQSPINPFYWGLYGGSEFAGILSSHVSFHSAALRSGYTPAATTVLLQADLTQPEPRDPKAVILRRQTALTTVDDAVPSDWLEAASLGPFRPTLYRLSSKQDDREIARARTWEMSGFGRDQNRVHLALHDVEVRPEFRRRGFGRFLVGEIIRKARSQWNETLDVQTRASNIPALSLYESLGFARVETSTLYRKPGP